MDESTDTDTCKVLHADNRIEFANPCTFPALDTLVGIEYVRHLAFSGDGIHRTLFNAHRTAFALVRQNFWLCQVFALTRRATLLEDVGI
jgi:hypothetical protein